MKFDFATLASEIEADWPVTVGVPLDGGKADEQTFTVRFRLVGEQELLDFGEGLDQSKAALRRVIVGLGRSEGKELTPELLEQLLAAPYVRVALNKAYGQFALGMPAKNSETPPA
jgi:hypothetical protein